MGCLRNDNKAMTRRLSTPPRKPLTTTTKTVGGLILLAVFGLLSSAWDASLVLFGLAILTPTLLKAQKALETIAAVAAKDDAQ